jgi:hypothetical protein
MSDDQAPTPPPVYWPTPDEHRGIVAERADDVERERRRRRVLRRILARVLS